LTVKSGAVTLGAGGAFMPKGGINKEQNKEHEQSLSPVREEHRQLFSQFFIFSPSANPFNASNRR
jgi:hypothetical protein